MIICTSTTMSKPTITALGVNPEAILAFSEVSVFEASDASLISDTSSGRYFNGSKFKFFHKNFNEELYLAVSN